MLYYAVTLRGIALPPPGMVSAGSLSLDTRAFLNPPSAAAVALTVRRRGGGKHDPVRTLPACGTWHVDRSNLITHLLADTVVLFE